MLARKTSKNQLTLPKEIVGNFPGIDLFDATVEENRIVLTPVKVVPAILALGTVRSKMKKLGLAPEDVAEAVQWARK
ncbi:MAG: AbrB/MazE/SpoVT family DNA-binding domain-containing protein [Planctomycetota bacterium]